MTELLKICGVALICTVMCLVLGRLQSGMGTAVRIGGTVLIFGAVLALLGDSIAELSGMLSKDTLSSGGAFSLMLKALGVAFISKLCADICRDCGETTLAGGVEAAGRAVMIALCLPVIGEILDASRRILEMGI